MNVNTLKPGLLVSIKTTIQGGVSYARQDIEPNHAEGDAQVAKWETMRRITNAEEYELAVKERSRARSLITSVCCASSFGLLCPEDREADLAAAYEQAYDIARQFNRSALYSQITVNMLAGRIARDDEQAARAISSEMRELMEDMTRAIARADVEQIRKAANAARAMQAMLSPEVAGKVSSAIAQAREAARDIVARVGKAGELAADVVASLNTERIETARFAFLDVDTEEQAIESAPLPSRAVDFSPVNEVQISAAPQTSLEF